MDEASSSIPQFCFNCIIYGWKELKDKSALKRCSKCKIAHYCSEQCQKENWHNTHKKHCKYMSKKKVLATGIHDNSACLACKEESQAGKEIVSEVCSFALPCTMFPANMRLTNLFMFDNVFDSIPLPEMTGKFHSKLDNSLAISLRILMKMKLANSIPWTVNMSRAEDLYNSLVECRFKACMLGMFAKPGSLNDDQFDMETYGGTVYLGKILKAWEDINCSISERYPRGLSVNMPWSTFEIVIGFIWISRYALGRCVADKLGVPELPDDMQISRLSHSQLNQMWANVLAVLHDGLVPLKTLHEAIIKDLPAQQCYGCKVQVEIKVVFFGQSIFSSEVPTDAVPFLLLGASGSVYSLCGKDECSAKLLAQSLSNRENRMIMLYERLRIEFGGERCDYCGLFNQEVRGYRCAGCKTKVYCGMECYRMDTVHHTLCEKGDTRKRKRGHNTRIEKGRELYVQFEEKLGLSSP